MAFEIGSACVACGACEAQCPVGAISMGDGQFVIDADKCIDCGSCAGQCPVGAGSVLFAIQIYDIFRRNPNPVNISQHPRTS